jgi:hypothetical protein
VFASAQPVAAEGNDSGKRSRRTETDIEVTVDRLELVTAGGTDARWIIAEPPPRNTRLRQRRCGETLHVYYAFAREIGNRAPMFDIGPSAAMLLWKVEALGPHHDDYRRSFCGEIP